MIKGRSPEEKEDRATTDKYAVCDNKSFFSWSR